MNINEKSAAVLRYEKREKRFGAILGTASWRFINSVVAGRHSTVIKKYTTKKAMG